MPVVEYMHYRVKRLHWHTNERHFGGQWSENEWHWLQITEKFFPCFTCNQNKTQLLNEF